MKSEVDKRKRVGEVVNTMTLQLINGNNIDVQLENMVFDEYSVTVKSATGKQETYISMNNIVSVRVTWR